MAEPIVTVLMTVHNGEPYVREAVASILSQTHDSFRFLILDDASTDNTRQTIRSFKDSRIDLIEIRKNIGQTAALNRGLQLIDTPFVARIDADDVSLPQRLEKQISYMDRYPQVALLGTWCQFINESGRVTSTFQPPTAHAELLDCFATHNPFGHSSVLFRQNHVQQVGGYPEDYLYAQDFPLWFQLACRYQVANLPDELVQIRVHVDQAGQSAEMQAVRLWDLMRVYRQASNFDGLSLEAQAAGRHTAAHTMLNYAVALSQEGHQRAALRWAVTTCLYHPKLCLGTPSGRIQVVRTLGGARGRQIARTIKGRMLTY